jgi:O-methyltransferase
LAAAKGSADLHLFDTFAGMPDTELAHDGRFRVGQLSDTSLATVQRKLSRWCGVHFHPGFFPDSARALSADLRFRLVHLDVDIRRSNLAALAFFYPRLLPGGQIVIHDYNAHSVPGTKLAVDEFMRDKPETVIELWHTQALIVKL